MKDLTLYGAGGHCFAIVELINSLKDYNPMVIVDDNPVAKQVLGIPVIESSQHSNFKQVVLTIGDNASRRKIVAKINEAHFPILVHQSVQKYPSVSLGKGTQILPGAVIDADVTIEDFCIINNHATLSHNVRVENFCHIAINAVISGGVQIGEGTLIGAGSIILPELKIGKWVTVGAGTVITKDIPDYAVVYGNPAKIHRYNPIQTYE